MQGAEGTLQESPSCRSSPTCGPQELDVLEEEELEKQGEQEGQQVPGRREGWEQVVGGQSRGQQSTSPCWGWVGYMKQNFIQETLCF